MHGIILSIVLLHLLSCGHCLEYCESYKATDAHLRTHPACETDAIDSASVRHHFVLLDHGPTPRSIRLRCHECYDRIYEMHVWKFIPRAESRDAVKVQLEFEYGNSYFLDQQKLKDVPTTNEGNQCMTPERDLILRDIDPNVFAGIYVCVSPKQDTRPVHFIWYHVDFVAQISPVQFHSDTIKHGITTVESAEQLKELQQWIRQSSLSYVPWEDKTSGPFRLTSLLDEDDYTIKPCQLLKIGITRQCYVEIPTKEPELFDTIEQREAYRLVRRAFEFIVKAQGYTMSSGRRIQKIVRKQIRKLSYDFHGNETHMYIPCGYSLFQMLGVIHTAFSGFPPRPHRFEETYLVSCGKPDFSELIEFVRKSDFSQLNVTIPSLIDFRYNKIQRLVLEGEKGVRLRCPADHPLNCSGPYPDAIWRSGNDLTFDKRRSNEDNVYVTETCELFFEQIHRFDLDIYYCHLRDMNSLTEVWSRRPRIAYRIQMEGGTVRWPRETDILVGLVVLIIWSICLGVLWVMLSLYDSVTREYALFEATVKQAGGRIARLKQVYSPFSDEDKALFFKVVPQE